MEKFANNTKFHSVGVVTFICFVAIGISNSKTANKIQKLQLSSKYFKMNKHD